MSKNVICSNCGRAFGDGLALLQHGKAVHRTNVVAVTRPNRRADDPNIEDWHAVGIAGCAVASRVKEGEDIEVDAEAKAIGISPRRLVRILNAYGAVIPEAQP